MTHSDPPADPTASPAAPAASVPPATDAPATPAPDAPGEGQAAAPAGEAAPADSAAPTDTPAPVADVPAIAPAAPYVPPARTRRCENCGTPLLGEHCYACGQPTKGLIRQFTTILGDFADTVFQVDSRVFRTLGPLLLRPGRLTLEYFEGHRIRYVSPVRLFVFISILAFVAAQWSWNINGDGSGNGTPGITINGGDGDSIDDAKTPEAVIAARDRAIAEFERAKREGKDVPGLAIGMDAAAREMRVEAAARIKELEAEARAEGRTLPAKPTLATRPAPPGVAAMPTPGEGPPPGTEGGLVVDDKDGEFRFNGKPWDAKTNPLVVGWLPAAANARLNVWIGRAKGNIERLKKDDDKNWIKDAFLSEVPKILILMLPLFALLLKVMYLFKRRLYMEHMVVALHSHAFICLVLLLQSLLSLLEGAVAAPGGFVAGVFAWVEGGLWAWIPVNLLLMQKRVYGQGWIMTLLKFGVVGMAYFFLLLFGGLAAMFITLVRA